MDRSKSCCKKSPYFQFQSRATKTGGEESLYRPKVDRLAKLFFRLLFLLLSGGKRIFLWSPRLVKRGKNRQEKLQNPFFNGQRAARIWFIVSTISIALIFGVEKKKEELFCLVTLHSYRGNPKSVPRRVSRLRLANVYESLLESGFEELIYGLVGGIWSFCSFYSTFFLRVTFSWQIEKDMDFFSFSLRDYFYFFLLFMIREL